MKTCDRCKKQVKTLYNFEIVSKVFNPFGSDKFETEVCEDCHEEGKLLLDDLGKRLDGEQRRIMNEAKNEWLQTPVPHADVKKWSDGIRHSQAVNETGASFIQRLVDEFKRLFNGSRSDHEL